MAFLTRTRTYATIASNAKNEAQGRTTKNHAAQGVLPQGWLLVRQDKQASPENKGMGHASRGDAKMDEINIG
jgi:hypothetical protein